MRMSVATAVACVLTTGLSVADQAAAAIRKATNIEAQGLAPALRLFAKQRDIQIVYRSDLVGGRQTSGAAGELTVDEALHQLLNGTGLTYRHLDDDGITIVPNAQASGSAAPAPSRSFWSRFRVAQLETSPRPSASATSAAPRGGGVGGSSSESASQRIEEVVVTAQRREERLESVPIAISVLGGDVLDQSTAQGVTQALNTVPGVITTAPIQGGTAQIAVRGVTAGAGFQNGSSPIAYYLDSVPFALVKTALVPDANAYDLERIEVLRGPQGTLYGASAQNGVVRILTRDADLNDFELKMRTAVSETRYGGENYRGDFALNAPLIEGKLAARAVVGYQDMSGWIDKPRHKDVNDAEVRTGRLKVNAQPTDQLAIGVSGWFSRSDFGAQNAGDESRLRSSDADESIRTDYDAFGLRIGYELPGVSVTSATGYLDYELTSNLDYLYPFLGIPGTLVTAMESSVFAQELTLNSSTEGAWRWSIGGMYRSGEDRLLQTLFVLPAPIDFTDESESFAVFGELTRSFADGRFEVTLGLRYFEDDVEQIENVRHTGVPTEPLYRASGTFDATSPRLVLSWHPYERATIYASYSEGFRSGFNQNANVPVGLFPAVKADTLKNYEVGAKGRTSDGLLSFDAAVFYIDWEDVQQTLTVDFGSVAVAALVNGESASGMGAELGVTLHPYDGLSIGLNGSWNDLTADSDLTSVANSIALFGKGDRLNFSPEYTAGATLDYRFAFGSSGYEGRFAGSGSYSSEQTYRNVLAGGVVVDVGEAMLIANTSFSIVSPHRWTVTLFVDNVGNEQDPGVGLFHVPDWQQRTRPRTAGVQFEYQL